jgi:hypothetical protein
MKIYQAVQKLTGGTYRQTQRQDGDLISLLPFLESRLEMWSKKWYFRIHYHLLDMSIVNAWLLYKRAETGRANPKETHKLSKFQSGAAKCLCMPGFVSRFSICNFVAHNMPAVCYWI